MSSKVHDVVVIGAGWSGLIAGKYALEEGLSPLVLEAREDLGGVWNFTPDPRFITVMSSTHTSSSSTVTELSDFPMPASMGKFPHHTKVKAYLRAYAERFGLLPFVRFGAPVASARKDASGVWITETKGGERHLSKNLIVSTGNHQQPNPPVPELDGFTGERVHAGTLKRIGDEVRGRRVLVVGGGETAADVVGELHRAGAKSIVWSIPRGQQFLRKRAAVTHADGLLSLFTRKSGRIVLDEAGSLAIRTVSPFRKGKPGMAWLCTLTTSGSPFVYNGHGIPEWRTEAPSWASFYNKHGHVLDLVYDRHVTPKGAVVRAEGAAVEFRDGSRAEVDLVVECTGYRAEFEFLPEPYRRPLSERYKLVMDVDDPTLLFLGFARPIITSIPMMTELQAMAFLPMLGGRRPRPGREEMRAEARADADERADYFKHTSRRIETLVEPMLYLEQLLRLAGREPPFRALFRDDPVRALKLCFAPLSMAYARLCDEDNREAARHLEGLLEPTWYISPFLFALSRALLQPQIFDVLHRLRYAAQVATRGSPFWGWVFGNRVVHGLRHFYRKSFLDCERPFGKKYSEIEPEEA